MPLPSQNGRRNIDRASLAGAASTTCRQTLPRARVAAAFAVVVAAVATLLLYGISRGPTPRYTSNVLLQTGTWQSCASQARTAIEAAAAADVTVGGWHGIQPKLQRRFGLPASWRRTHGSFGSAASSLRGVTASGPLPSGHKPSGAAPMLAVTTANVWEKTELMLHSLAAVTDPFQLLVVDEQSTDGTVAALRAAQVAVVQTSAANGVTYNWNLAYQTWLATASPYLFISNNDVLVPSGALDAMTHAMTPEGGDCDVIAPLSTMLGKGAWGRVEGAEILFNLSIEATAFVGRPLNYQRVQDALSCSTYQVTAAARQNRELHKMSGFSGFFFGVRRSTVQNFAVNSTHLFDPAIRNIGQESDLTSRLDARGGKICLHLGAWVFHYKGSTIPPALGLDREGFNVVEAATAAAAARAKAKAPHAESPLPESALAEPAVGGSAHARSAHGGPAGAGLTAESALDESGQSESAPAGLPHPELPQAESAALLGTPTAEDRQLAASDSKLGAPDTEDDRAEGLQKLLRAAASVAKGRRDGDTRQWG